MWKGVRCESRGAYGDGGSSTSRLFVFRIITLRANKAEVTELNLNEAHSCQ